MGPTIDRGRLRERARRTSVVGRALVHEVRAENLTFMAGSIAYHAFVSLLPLLVLLLVALSSIGGEPLADRILVIVELVLTPGGRDAIADAIESGVTVSGVSVLGLGVLVWATLRIFRGLDQAFSDIYETESVNTLLDQLRDGLLMLIVVATAVIGGAIVHTSVTFGDGIAGTALETLFAVLALVVAFLPMYYLFPDVDVGLRGALPGTVFAAAGVTALESAFRLYVEFSTTDEYGILGAVLVFVTWLYFNSLVILAGAALNAVLTNYSEDVDLRPVIGDHRPGIGRTFGAAGAGGEREAVSERLQTLADRLEDAEWMTVTVDGDEIRLPVPAETTIRDGTEGDAVGIEFDW